MQMQKAQAEPSKKRDAVTPLQNGCFKMREHDSFMFDSFAFEFFM